MKRQNPSKTCAIGLFAALLVVGGCAPEIASFGPETYVAEFNAIDGVSFAEAVRAANKHCAKQGKHFSPVMAQGTILTFRCLSEGDPELTRPTPQPVPNTVIDRR